MNTETSPNPHARAAEIAAEAALRACHFPGCGAPWASFGFENGRRWFCRAHVVKGEDGHFEPMPWKAVST